MAHEVHSLKMVEAGYVYVFVRVSVYVVRSYSALHLACERRQLAVVRCLIDKHADLFALDDQGIDR